MKLNKLKINRSGVKRHNIRTLEIPTRKAGSTDEVVHTLPRQSHGVGSKTETVYRSDTHTRTTTPPVVCFSFQLFCLITDGTEYVLGHTFKFLDSTESPDAVSVMGALCRTLSRDAVQLPGFCSVSEPLYSGNLLTILTIKTLKY